MSVLTEALRGQRIVVGVPAEGVDPWVPLAEVLLWEGLDTWLLPATWLDRLPGILALFGLRARVGVSGLTDAAGVRAAVDAGAHFLTSPVFDPTLADAAGAVPLVPGALTPQEIATAVRHGADALQVVPADVMGSAYARALPPLFPGVALMPVGRIERYQADMWLKSGAAAVCTDAIVQAGESDPAAMRRRAQQFRQLVATES